MSVAPDLDAHTPALTAGRGVILAEAKALETLADALDHRFDAAVGLLRAAKGRVIVTGMGKSGHVGAKIAATLASTGRPAQFVHPAEASHGDLGMITAEDCVLAISRSGETRELSDLVYHTRRLRIPLVALTFVPGSTLAEAADVALILPDVGEASEDAPAPTTSTTMCLALGDALSVAILQANGFTASDFRGLHPGGKLGAMLAHVGDLMRKGDDIPLIAPDAPFQDMILTMTEKRIGCVGVIDAAGQLIGVVTDGDLRRRLTPDSFAQRPADLMTANPRTISAGATAADALSQMNAEAQKVTVLFVVEHGRPVGVLHMHDLLMAGVR